MRKSLIVTIAAALLLAAVICTAGCIGDSGQQQTSDKSTLWVYTDDTGSTLRFITMSPDGTGTFEAYEVKTAENGEDEYRMITEHGFTWTKEADKTIKILPENEGESTTLIMDEVFGLLTSQSGKVYQLIPSELSGQHPPHSLPGWKGGKPPGKS